MAELKLDTSAIRDKDDLCSKLLHDRRVSEANATVDARVVKGVQEDEAEEDVETEEQIKYLVEDPSLICHVGGEWEEFEGLLDSGASTNVASPVVGQGVEIRESVGSRTGHVYHTADGSKLPNLGEKVLHVQTENYDDFTMTMQMANVKKPLMSVSKVCDAGTGQNFVAFTAEGGYIWHADRGKYTSFRREGGVYPLKTWIRRPIASGTSDFARPGPCARVNAMLVVYL